MKNTILSLVSALSIFCVCAQDLPAAGGVSNNIIGHTAFAEAYDVNGKPLTNANKKVAGVSVLNEEWGKGQVLLQNGFLLKNAELQFDLYSNELHFKKDNIGYSFVDPLKEFSMEFTEHGVVRFVTFRSGYPAIQKKNEHSFYQVIVDGQNIQLLDFMSKEVRENYVYSGPVINEYQQNDAYYVYDVKKGIIKSFNLNKPSLVKAIPDYSGKIENFAADKNYRLKSISEIIELFQALNGK